MRFFGHGANENRMRLDESVEVHDSRIRFGLVGHSNLNCSAPVPQVVGTMVELVQVIAQEHISERIFEHITDVLGPRILEESVAVVRMVSQE